jgi:hypothetical protein
MVADREGDLFELLEEAEATRKRVGVPVRASHNRRLQGREQKLWETLQASPNETRLEVTIPRQRGKPAKRGKPEQKALPAPQATLTVRRDWDLARAWLLRELGPTIGKPSVPQR